MGIYGKKEYSRKCNGFGILCNRQYNDVSFIKTRSSFAIASRENKYSGTQVFSIETQLNNGARAFQLNIYLDDSKKGLGDKVVLCFPDCSNIRGGTLLDTLNIFFSWLENNPDNILTIFLDNRNGIGIEPLKESFRASRMDSFIYPKSQFNPSIGWPTLAEFIDSNKKVLVFEENSNLLSANSDWIFSSSQNILKYDYSPEYVNNTWVSSPYTSDGIKSLTEIPHYATKINTTFNQFGYPEVSNIEQAKMMNSRTMYLHGLRCFSGNSIRWNNFFLIDFFGIGKVDNVIFGLNSIPLPNKTITNFLPKFYNQTSPNMTKIFQDIKNETPKILTKDYLFLQLLLTLLIIFSSN
ncbi:hypothetical protein AYI68_g1309 [Smittium mucronatum]|uniref:PI-PLC X domain-containing protein n=1 Tax=Smittium mucronatum TaxID=133383 RepID=A0A1R0H5W0_9FUNG|nr:hypothetical protein AYI68_g1309 [Smittium mucronatum]